MGHIVLDMHVTYASAYGCNNCCQGIISKDEIMEYSKKLETLRVLFIDDDHLLRRSMGYIFRKKVSTFIAVETAEQGLQRLKTEIFDVVICDYRLPGMDGLRFFENLEETHPGLDKILVTAYLRDTLEEEAKRSGVRTFIRKPFDANEIESALVKIGGIVKKRILP